MTNTPYTVVLGEDKIALFQFDDYNLLAVSCHV